MDTALPLFSVYVFRLRMFLVAEMKNSLLMILGLGFVGLSINTLLFFFMRRRRETT